jgi:hypothetical protein
MARISTVSKIVICTVLAGLFMLFAGGCRGISYIPGASFGYYIWEEGSRIFIEWSVDKKDTKFDGSISTDGKITDYKLTGWEEGIDVIKIEEDRIVFSATLNDNDYSDGFNFNIEDHTYLEFDLKINDGYDLNRINAGGFLENPESNVFKIDKDYFDRLGMKHWYQKHPFSEFFYKLFSNKYFTFLYIFILGIVIIEILRVTTISRKKRKVTWLAVSYAVLIAVEVLIYFILKFLVK